MVVEFLVAAMNQEDHSLIEKENLSEANVLVVNQTSGIDEEVIATVGDRHRFLNTGTRGLSVSRNLAKKNSIGDICIVADDDERFFDDTSKIVEKAYIDNPRADIIIFKIKNLNKKYWDKKKYLNMIDIFRVSSVQITYKKESVSDVWFDQKMGAGTGNGAGEENKFLFECIKKKKKILYVPEAMGELLPAESSWFAGYDEDYFYKRGMTTRYTFGWVISILYAFYYIVCKRKTFSQSISPLKALKATLRGIKDNKLSKE